MDATAYSGNDGTQAIVNAGGIQPDFVWIKVRNEVNSHYLFDQIRGADQALFSDSTSAEVNYSATGRMTSFNSNGFTVKYSSSTGTNASGDTYIGWQWRASNTTPVTNNAGTITSTVSTNTTSGFSIVTYTGTGGSGTTTVGHGLSTAPAMVITKRRNTTGAWSVYQKNLTSTSHYLELNTTAAQQTYGSTFISPGASTLTIAADSSLLNANGSTYVAYCFAEVVGYSKFGSYTGNGNADGAFVYTGFRPEFVMVKRTDSSDVWLILDAARDTSNVVGNLLQPQSSDADQFVPIFDFLSNGFKLRASGNPNNNGGTFIYMAFAEMPTTYANAR